MSVTLVIRDETMTGQAVNELSLDFLTERITVGELIRSRVYQEVKDHNVRMAQAEAGAAAPAFRGLVQPGEAERALNGPPREKRPIDWQRQFEVATEAFERNGFLILIDDRQARTLEEEIEVKAGTQVSFVKLVPLVGG